MKGKTRAILCWSGGKDSAFCLHRVQKEGLFDVRYLLTTVNERFKRVSMHGIREELLDRQVESTGIPLLKVRVSEGSNQEYEQKMDEVLSKARSEGIDHVIFGDIFLEDLREYRKENLARAGMKAVFPLWKTDTASLIREFADLGFGAVICCTNDAFLGKEWLGRTIDASFPEVLPARVDPCGENGEYHTFCFKGPVFNKEIPFTAGEKVFQPLNLPENDRNVLPSTRGFHFVDLRPVSC